MCFNNISLHTVGSRFFSSLERRQVLPAWRKLKNKNLVWEIEKKSVLQINQLTSNLVFASNNIHFHHKWTINLTVINKVFVKDVIFYECFPPCYGIEWVGKKEKDELLIAFAAIVWGHVFQFHLVINCSVLSFMSCDLCQGFTRFRLRSFHWLVNFWLWYFHEIFQHFWRYLRFC